MKKTKRPRDDEPPEEGGDADAVAPSIGGVIRRARKQQGLTLQHLAESSELSLSYLSQIERNLLNPSVGTLKRIAEALDLPAGKLMFASESGTSRVPVAVLRKGRRKTVSFPQSSIRYDLLTPDLRRRASVLWLSAEPGAESGAPMTHEGEDVVVLLKGRLDVEVGGTWYELAAGDSICFNSELPHRWANRGKVTAEAIWVSSPPSF